MKRISLIVPVYNALAYLPDMVESVLSQNWENLQLIFSDDGSTDGSLAWLRQLSARDCRVTVVAGENTGVSSARNRALQLADGDYIGFSDADDTLAPGYFQTLAGLLETYHADVACCGFDRIYEAAGIADRMPVRDGTVFTADRDTFLSWLLRPDGYTTVVWNKLFRREVLLQRDGCLLRFDEDVHIVEDGVWLFRAAMADTGDLETGRSAHQEGAAGAGTAKAFLAVFTPEPLYRYTVRTSGAMYGEINPRKLTELTARKRIVELAGSASNEVQQLAEMKYQKGVRDLLFHAVISGNRRAVRSCFPELRVWRHTFFASSYLSRKEKLKYRIYPLLIVLNLRRTGSFLMRRLSGHGDSRRKL